MVKLKLNKELLGKPLIKNYIKRKARKMNNAHYSENPEDYFYVSGTEDNSCYRIIFECKTNQSRLTVKINKI